MEAALSAQGKTLTVSEHDERKDAIVRDRHEVRISLCARLYSKGSAKSRAKRPIQAATGE